MDRDARIATRNVERNSERDARLDPEVERDIGISDHQDGSLGAQDSLHEVEQDAREKVYPAPLAGVEPLEGHPMDPDGEEESVEDAEQMARSDRYGDAPTMELTMTSAQLDGLTGVGLLREVRDSDGDIAEVPGSWRPGTEVDELPSALVVGHTTRFEGSLHKADGSVQHVVSDVDITSLGDYTTEEGERLRMVNFKVSVPGMLVHAASDDGALPPG